jgi:hypothetical protein
MQTGGALAEVFGGLVGVGPGAGMSVMLVFAGLATAAIGLSGYLFPAIRNVEADLPDHVQTEGAGEALPATMSLAAEA